MKNGYMRIQTGNGFNYEHRYVWEQNRGPIPNGYVVHHINGDRTDNRIDNLELLKKRRHDSITSSEAWDRRINGEFPPVFKPNQKNFNKSFIEESLTQGKSIRQIARELKVSHGTIRRNIKDYRLTHLVKDRTTVIRKELLIQSFKSCHTIAQIASVLGVSEYAVSKNIKAYGLDAPTKRRYKDIEDKNSLISLVNTLGSIRKAAAQLGVSHTFVMNRLKKHGYTWDKYKKQAVSIS